MIKIGDWILDRILDILDISLLDSIDWDYMDEENWLD